MSRLFPLQSIFCNPRPSFRQWIKPIYPKAIDVRLYPNYLCEAIQCGRLWIVYICKSCSLGVDISGWRRSWKFLFSRIVKFSEGALRWYIGIATRERVGIQMCVECATKCTMGKQGTLSLKNNAWHNIRCFDVCLRFSKNVDLYLQHTVVTADITRGWEPFHHQRHLSVPSKILWVFFDWKFFTNIMWFDQMRICPKPQNDGNMKCKSSWSVWDSSHTHLLVWMSCFRLFHEFRWAEYGISCQRENIERQQLEARM